MQNDYEDPILNDEVDNDESSSEDGSLPSRKPKRLQQSERRWRKMLMEEREEKNKAIALSNKLQEELRTKRLERDKYELMAAKAENEHIELLEDVLSKKLIDEEISNDPYAHREINQNLNKLKEYKKNNYSVEALTEARIKEIEKEKIAVVPLDERPIPTAEDLEKADIYVSFLKRNPELDPNDRSFDRKLYSRANDLSIELAKRYRSEGRGDKVQSREFVRELESIIHSDDRSNDTYSTGSLTSQSRDFGYSPSLEDKISPVKNTSYGKLTPAEERYLQHCKSEIKDFDEAKYREYVLASRSK